MQPSCPWKGPRDEAKQLNNIALIYMYQEFGIVIINFVICNLPRSHAYHWQCNSSYGECQNLQEEAIMGGSVGQDNSIPDL